MRAWNNNTLGQFQTRKGAIYECFFSSVEPQKFEPIVDANEYKSGSPSITELRAFCVPNLAASLISTYLLLTFSFAFAFAGYYFLINRGSQTFRHGLFGLSGFCFLLLLLLFCRGFRGWCGSPFSQSTK